ncbi:hypothetical protein [Pyxidicoccus sp. MSG2]|uniref:hypothetical protein n=1 Tax=Pyxidicoccus sp. MSG2 TaxID=2996790 RepID=UPI00226FF647|nr:hypothetical protein [Pyxidicoccus sp. MSG2]MCY1020182.1 hypothetical protein [Pyxidicoccus sp. MSG2]
MPSPSTKSSSSIQPLKATDTPAASGSWEYNGFSLSWETSDPYSVTLNSQCGDNYGGYTLQSTSNPQCTIAEAPLKTEARLDLASQIQMGSSGPVSIILTIQLSPDIVLRTNIGGWNVNRSPDHPDSISSWWPMQASSSNDYGSTGQGNGLPVASGGGSASSGGVSGGGVSSVSSYDVP